MENYCNICGNNHENIIHIAREMNFGLKDEFEYLECSNCGCVQLINTSLDLSKYYPSDYYSFKIPTKRSSFKKFRMRYRTLHWLNEPTIIGRILCKLKAKPDYLKCFEELKIDFSARILDVGCGTGDLLRNLGDSGFTNLTGVDPYVDHDINYENVVNIYRKEIFDLHDCKFDLIMLNHSFEHMSQPEKVLDKIYELLTPNGYAVIRIPIASSYAWYHYRTNWVQLDAPRHLFLHTVKSIEILLKKTNLKEKYIRYDSSEMQFLGSEHYKKGIPLIKFKRSDFTKKEIEHYMKMAKDLNDEQQGDQACFYLQKA